MFGRKNNVSESEELKKLKAELKKKEDAYDDLLHSSGLAKKELEADKRILEREMDSKVVEALAERNKVIEGLERDKAVLQKEVEILTKAFETMGFDVKDMKEILNKLVDGLIAKNEIKLVK